MGTSVPDRDDAGGDQDEPEEECSFCLRTSAEISMITSGVRSAAVCVACIRDLQQTAARSAGTGLWIAVHERLDGSV
jgi:hypothetical protein